MMKSERSRTEDARRRAQEQFAKTKQRNADTLKDRERVRQATAAKTARLRALRLAKEAADKEALARDAAEKATSAKDATALKAAARRKSARVAKAKLVRETEIG